MEYFRKEYVDGKHTLPERWLFFGQKEYFYSDFTNNTAETTNKVLKEFKRSRFDVKKSILTTLEHLKESESTYFRSKEDHCYKRSLKCSMKLKEEREKEIEEYREENLAPFELTLSIYH